MEFSARIDQFIDHPFPLWETTLTHQLVQHQWRALESKGFLDITSYSTARVWLNNPSLRLDKRKKVTENSLYVETPSLQLQSFYDEHGLKLLTEKEMEESATLPKLNKALSLFRLIQPVYTCIIDLVRAIHILRQPDAEIDLSYSHPQIPFSIFLSVCGDDSIISNLRVAESILHEAMHLKLTLIENLFPLVKPNTDRVYYSPWRDEERPVRGVLHGLFVFRAIWEFYNEIATNFDDKKVKKAVSSRLEDIHSEIVSLVEFHKETSLTGLGQDLVFRLLQHQGV